MVVGMKRGRSVRVLQVKDGLPDIEIGYARNAGPARDHRSAGAADGSRHAAQSQEQLLRAAYLAIARDEARVSNYLAKSSN